MVAFFKKIPLQSKLSNGINATTSPFLVKKIQSCQSIAYVHSHQNLMQKLKIEIRNHATKKIIKKKNQSHAYIKKIKISIHIITNQKVNLMQFKKKKKKNKSIKYISSRIKILN